MLVRIPLLLDVDARRDDVLHVYYVGPATEELSRTSPPLNGNPNASRPAKMGLRGMFNSLTGTDEIAPFVFNETAGCWSVSSVHVNASVNPDQQGARLFDRYPKRDLPVSFVVTGRLIDKARIDFSIDHQLTNLTIDVIQQRAIQPGEDWLPS